eukprot:COSAG02_NODE_199_length_29529_cov_32.558289_4_plen_65_part_00
MSTYRVRAAYAIYAVYIGAGAGAGRAKRVYVYTRPPARYIMPGGRTSRLYSSALAGVGRGRLGD